MLWVRHKTIKTWKRLSLPRLYCHCRFHCQCLDCIVVADCIASVQSALELPSWYSYTTKSRAVGVILLSLREQSRWLSGCVQCKFLVLCVFVLWFYDESLMWFRHIITIKTWKHVTWKGVFSDQIALFCVLSEDIESRSSVWPSFHFLNKNCNLIFSELSLINSGTSGSDWAWRIFYTVHFVTLTLIPIHCPITHLKLTKLR